MWVVSPKLSDRKWQSSDNSSVKCKAICRFSKVAKSSTSGVKNLNLVLISWKNTNLKILEIQKQWTKPKQIKEEAKWLLKELKQQSTYWLQGAPLKRLAQQNFMDEN